MFNKSGITKTSYTNRTDILVNPDNFMSVGCIVAQAVGATEGSLKIAKAGTPIKIDLNNLQTPAVKADASDNAMNAVLLHDVDVTAGNANGTAVIFGFFNLNMIGSTTQSDVTTAVGNANASKLLTFIKF